MQWLYYANIKLINVRQKNMGGSLCFRIHPVKFIEMGIHPFTLD